MSSAKAGDREVEADASAAAKRRKLRKGTRSCWECKRRKMRCVFSSSAEIACNACQRRGTVCLSQELEELPKEKADGGDQQVNERLRRIEELLTHLISDSNKACEISASEPIAAAYEQICAEFQPSTSSGHDTPGSSTSKTYLMRPCSPLVPPSANFLEQALLAAWPERSDSEIITKLDIDLFQFLRSTKEARRLPSYSPKSQAFAESLLQLPPSSLGPVGVAKRLLALGLFIQCARLRTDKLHSIMARVVTAARHLVTSRIDLVSSVDGIECLMMESIYANNAGHLHQAWQSSRHALSVAQMMRLHQNQMASVSPTQQSRDVNSDFSYLWFRLVQMDRYLSLMLNLPLGVGDDHDAFAKPEVLQQCEPHHRLERIHCHASGRILCPGFQSTRLHLEKADDLFQIASKCMPSQWWSMPDLSQSGDCDEELAAHMDRIMSQFLHYHLLVLLHMPTYVREPTRFYSQMTTVNSSREVLMRYAAIKSSFAEHTPCYCPGIDTIAFLSGIALCIAHMKSQANDQSLRFLHHQRSVDRALLVDSLAMLQQGPQRKTNTQIVDVFTRILEMEENSFLHTHNDLTITLSERTGVDIINGFGGEWSGDDQMLHIFIPSVGIIQVELSQAPSQLSIHSNSPMARIPVNLSLEEVLADMPVTTSLEEAPLIKDRPWFSDGIALSLPTSQWQLPGNSLENAVYPATTENSSDLSHREDFSQMLESYTFN